jgi:hypothetical protein
VYFLWQRSSGAAAAGKPVSLGKYEYTLNSEGNYVATWVPNTPTASAKAGRQAFEVEDDEDVSDSAFHRK